MSDLTHDADTPHDLSALPVLLSLAQHPDTSRDQLLLLTPVCLNSEGLARAIMTNPNADGEVVLAVLDRVADRIEDAVLSDALSAVAVKLGRRDVEEKAPGEPGAAGEGSEPDPAPGGSEGGGKATASTRPKRTAKAKTGKKPRPRVQSRRNLTPSPAVIRENLSLEQRQTKARTGIKTAKLVLEWWEAEDAPAIRLALLRNQYAGKPWLLERFRDGDPAARQAICQNLSCPSYILVEALEDPVAKVRFAAVKNRNLSPKAMMIAAQSEDDAVRHWLAFDREDAVQLALEELASRPDDEKVSQEAGRRLQAGLYASNPKGSDWEKWR